jgi:MFS family permease
VTSIGSTHTETAEVGLTEGRPAPSRWRVPLGAVLVHLCIGSVYAWSTLNRPIQQLFVDQPWWLLPPYTTFTTALAMLGVSAAIGGPWVERRGPRVAARAAALLFGVGLVIGGFGLSARQPLLVFLGMGIVGGIGCGLGYIAPVSTLVKWFPDRRGMATGMAIMGFGGGAFIAGFLNVFLIARIGIATTVMVLGVGYLVIMMLGAILLVSPPDGWSPPGWRGRAQQSVAHPARGRAPMITTQSVSRNVAVRTPQFALLWGILFINVTAGIGILAQASPMMQDLFQRTPLQAAAVVSFISIFNASGRFLWASASDYIGRRNTYLLFFALQLVLFLSIPGLATQGQWLLFQISLFAIFTMYGGGFATIPAFLADIFGPQNVGAIHGALLTAWSAAAIVGPLIITELSKRAKAALPPGGARVHIYDGSLHILAALLALGFVLTLCVRPLRSTAHASP